MANRSCDQVADARLDDRGAARIDVLDLRLVHIDAEDVVSLVGQTCRRRDPDIAQTEDRDPHHRPSRARLL